MGIIPRSMGALILQGWSSRPSCWKLWRSLWDKRPGVLSPSALGAMQRFFWGGGWPGWLVRFWWWLWSKGPTLEISSRSLDRFWWWLWLMIFMPKSSDFGVPTKLRVMPRNAAERDGSKTLSQQRANPHSDFLRFPRANLMVVDDGWCWTHCH